MKVMCLADSGAGPVLIEAEAQQPRPGRGELLIRTCAAGVTPTELIWYPTSHKRTGEKRTCAVPGREFSGVVAGLGEEAGSTNIGDEAAPAPISALTAWQGLFDRAKLQSRERVLVHGGAGAVGIFAVQLAKLHGAHVTATASARDLAFVRALAPSG